MKKEPIKKSKNRFLCDSYRIIDVNFNRSKEGLRVCEEISRFHLNDVHLTKKISTLRHQLTKVMKSSKLELYFLFQQRDSTHDVGKKFCCEPKRKSFKDIFMCNAQRTKEAFRVLEEFMKMFDSSASKKIQKIRFDFYAIEKNAIERFPSLLNTR